MLASVLAGTPRLIVGKLNAALNFDDVHVRAGEKIGRKREVTVFVPSAKSQCYGVFIQKPRFDFELIGGP